MKQIFTFFLCLGLSIGASAQSWILNEAGLSIGAGTYFGELSNQTFSTEYSRVRFGLGGHYKYNPTPHFSFGFHVAYTQLEDQDDDGEVEGNLDSTRNLSFKNNVYEITGQIDWNILPFSFFDYKVSPYIFAGAGVLYHSPETLLGGEWFDLQPLGTEGQYLPWYEDDPNRQPYSNWAVVFPLGIGLKVALNEKIYLGYHIGYRITLTDYLDDVSGNYAEFDDPPEEFLNGEDIQFSVTSRTLSNRSISPNSPPDGSPITIDYTETDARGDPTNNDAYLITAVSLSFTIAEDAFQPKNIRGRFGVNCSKF